MQTISLGLSSITRIMGHIEVGSLEYQSYRGKYQFEASTRHITSVVEMGMSSCVGVVAYSGYNSIYPLYEGNES